MTAHQSIAGRAVFPVCLVLLATIAILAFRQPATLRFPQFWAEDAAIFYPEAELLGTQTLVRPYAGYWHVYPRLVALVGTATPIRRVPALYLLGALAATVAALSIAALAGLSRRRVTQAALVGGALLTPFSREVWLILTNVQWLLGILLVAVLASPRPATRAARTCLVVGAVLACGTGPFALLLAPLAFARAWWHRDRWSVGLLLLVLAGAAATLTALANDPRGDAVLGVHTRIGALWHVARTRPKLTLLAAGVFAGLCWAVVTGARQRDWPVVACAAAALLVAAGTALAIPAAHLQALPSLGGRYVFVPWICTLWTSVLLLDRGHRAAWLPLAAMTVVSVLRFPIPAVERHDWPRDAACLETHVRCDIVVNPSWRVGLPGRGPERR